MMTSNGHFRPVRPGESRLTFCWEVQAFEARESLADFLYKKLKLPMNQVVDLIDFGSVQIEGRQCRDPRCPLAVDQQITVHLPWSGVHRSYEINVQRILYRDRYLLA
ncbi:MAG TPA: hypothetical protein DCE18_12845, partial [Syntrophobacteraceae bacterium]|nr:hypothetical protein [Syntrophobacteraceae bacterium]